MIPNLTILVQLVEFYLLPKLGSYNNSQQQFADRFEVSVNPIINSEMFSMVKITANIELNFLL
jgi:hypothetical protein